MAEKYEKYQDRDYSNDQIPPRLVHEQLRAHDKRMKDRRENWALTKACYTTNYWNHIRDRNYSKTEKHRGGGEVNVEVNRLFGIITSYLSSLYPRSQRAIVSPDPNGIGDSTKAELALNRFMESSRIHHRIMTALRQGLLYPGSGAKVGYYAGRGNPLDRVWMRVIPWWEMVLDVFVVTYTIDPRRRWKRNTDFRTWVALKEMIFLNLDIREIKEGLVEAVTIQSKTKQHLTTRTLFVFLRFAI